MPRAAPGRRVGAAERRRNLAKDLPLRKDRANRPLAAVASPPGRPAAGHRAEAVARHRAAEATPAAPTLPRWRFPARLTVEGILYLAIGVAALLSRFFDLGRQAQHHDESLHDFFSWQYYVGSGYVHDPLMHGPFLFHGAALAYFLFGDSDASARYFAAAFGAATVLLPWFLRRELGRWGALIASGLLLASPSFLYFGRFHRHDVYSAFFTLLFFVAIIRYIAGRRPVWIFVGAAAWGFHLANKEDFFIISAIFGSALVVALCWPSARRLLWFGAGLLVAFAFAAKVLPRLLGWPKMPPIPWNTPTNAEIQAYVVAFFTHPVVLTCLVILAGFAALLVRHLKGFAGEATWNDALFGAAEPGTPGAAAHALFGNRRLLFTALGLFGGIYTVLYTSFFSNLLGLFSGSFGAVFYWLGQQNVRRGEQPWFYYLLLMPQYDPISVLLGGFGTILTGWRLFAHRAFGREEGPAPFVRGFIAYWAFISVALYSWTGEKMPWIVIHPVLPLLLMAAVILGRVVEWGIGRAEIGSTRASPPAEAPSPVPPPAFRLPHSSWVYGGLMLIALVGGFIATARLASDTGPLAAYEGWGLLAIPWLLIAVLAAAQATVRGWRRAGRTTVLALAAALLLFQVHAGWALAYQTGDVPKDMLVYVQTSPDVTRFMDELDEFSALQTGGKDLPILYDDNTSWPFQWYLRNYTRKSFFACSGGGCTLTGPPDENVAIVLVGNENLSAQPQLAGYLSDYVGQPYAMRWHFPEEVYRNFAIAPELGPGWSAWQYQNQPRGFRDVVASVFSSLTATATPQGQARLFRILAYRDLGAPLGSYDFTVFVRKDLVPQFNTIRYR